MIKSFCLFLSAFFLLSCSNTEQPQIPENKKPKDNLKQDFIDFNKGYMEFEENEIKDYIDSLQLDMKLSPMGFYYRVLREGAGQKAEKTYRAYTLVTLAPLHSNPCSDYIEKPKDFVLGASNVIIGLEDVVLSMKVGGISDCIIPAMLAYGVSGLKGCVPSYSPVRCQVELLRLEKVPSENNK